MILVFLENLESLETLESLESLEFLEFLVFLVSQSTSASIGGQEKRPVLEGGSYGVHGSLPEKFKSSLKKRKLKFQL